MEAVLLDWLGSPPWIWWKQGQALEGLKRGGEGVEMCSYKDLMQ